MRDWLISMPAWGDRCVGAFVNTVLPAIRAAANGRGRFRFLIHTDQSARISRAIGGDYQREFRPVPPGLNAHYSLGDANREALQDARPGEAVAFINADMVPSIECFAAAERRFDEGKRLIIMAATRTLSVKPPPVGASSIHLLSWCMENTHPSVRDCFWGEGFSSIPWAVYFRGPGDSVVLHGFHLHPFAVVKDKRPIAFEGATTDRDLVDACSRDEIHLVTSADEAAFAEMSPPERTFPKLSHVINIESISRWGRRNASETHRWMFSQPIAICGDGSDIGDRKICDEILNEIKKPEPMPPPRSLRRAEIRRLLRIKARKS